MVHHGLAVADVEHAGLEAHEAAGGDLELHVSAVVVGLHVGHDATHEAELLDDLASVLGRSLDHGLLIGLEELAVLVLVIDDAGTADLELVALAAHALHENSQVQDAATGDLDARVILELVNGHRDVGLFLGHQALLELAGAHDVVLVLATHERRGGSLENDRQRGGINMEGLKVLGVLGIGEHVADVGAVGTHDCGDVASLSLGALFATKVVKGEERLDRGRGSGAVVLDDSDLVALVHRAGVDAAHADAAKEVVVVDVDDLHGKRGVDVNFGSGQAVDDHVEQRIHVHVAVFGIKTGIAVDTRGEDDVLHGEGELLVGGAQVAHQVEHVVDGSLGTGAGTVDLVDDDHDGKAGRDSVGEHETRLGHGALEGVNEQQGAVGHMQNALDLATEVSVARSVDHVDLDALVLNGDVLGKDGDAALALLVVRVEDALLHLLVGTEGVRRTQELVAQGSLTMVDVGDDCNVSQVLLTHMFFNLSDVTCVHAIRIASSMRVTPPHRQVQHLSTQSFAHRRGCHR